MWRKERFYPKNKTEGKKHIKGSSIKSGAQEQEVKRGNTESGKQRIQF